MSKYINKINFLLVIVIFIALRLMDFNQTMTSFWVGPVLSAATNFDITNWNMYINWDEIKVFSELSKDEFWKYGMGHGIWLDYRLAAYRLVVLAHLYRRPKHRNTQK